MKSLALRPMALRPHLAVGLLFRGQHKFILLALSLKARALLFQTNHFLCDISHNPLYTEYRYFYETSIHLMKQPIPFWNS